MSIFTKIGAFFVGIFNAAKKAYLQLSEEEQLALQSGTGLVAVINSMLSAGVVEVRAAFSQKFPSLDEAKVESALLELGTTFLGSQFKTGDEVIVAIQAKLASVQGKGWAALSHGIAVALSLIFAPASTKAASITALIEYCYQHFIKKSVEA